MTVPPSSSRTEPAGAAAAASGSAARGSAEAPPTLDAAAQPSLLADRARLVQRNLPWALVGIAANTLVATAYLWASGVGPVALFAWCGFLLAVAVGRAVTARLTFRWPESEQGAGRWLRLVRGSVAVSGVAWGAGALLPGVDMMDLVLIAFLTGGLLAGAAATYAAVPNLAYAFMLPAAGLVVTALALHATASASLMAAMVAFFALVMVFILRNAHETVTTGLKLRHENRGLVTFLTEAKATAERYNQDLSAQIRERGQAEQALRESEERFRALVENATDGIGFTYEGRILYANQAALDLIGYEADEVLGMPIEHFLATTTVPEDGLQERYEQRMAGQEVPSQYEAQMVRKDGTVIEVMFSNSLVTLDGKRGVMSIAKDITARKRAEQELREAKETAEAATRLKDQFVSLLAHDLRAPLNSIVSMVAALRDETSRTPAAQQQELLRVVNEQGEGTLRMIEDLLNVSELRTGKLKPEPRFIDAAGLVVTATEALRHLAGEKRIEIVNDVPPRSRLHADPDMLGKVIYNLLSNAIKFSPRGGRVRVFVPFGRAAALAVENSGQGVAPDLIGDLFRHEVKTTTTGSAGERGMGLGLPLSQDLMQALGGEITVESDPGEGAVFYATLPAVRPRVLVLGRDDSLALFVRPHLESIDAECIAADSPEDARARLERDAPHLVIAEADPRAEQTGRLIEGIRALPGGRAAPLMLVADHSTADVLEHGFRLGADEIMIKPLVPGDFLVRLRRFIG